MTNRLLKAALAGVMTFTLTACPGGDSTGPSGPQIELTEAETEDLLDALSSIGLFDSGLFRMAQASIRAGNDVAFATFPMNDSYDCPNGGSVSENGSYTINEVTGAGSINVTINYNNCKATSNMGTLWTVKGAPNLQVNMNFAVDMETFEYTANGTYSGAIHADSDIGSGNCAINLTYNLGGTSTSDQGTITGSICGRPVSETINETF